MTAPEMSNQLSIDPAYARVAAVSPPATPTPTTQSFPPTHQPPPNQQQGQFQPAYFQQYPRSYGQPFQSYNAPQGQTPFTQQPPNQFQQQQQYQQQFQQQQQQPQYVANAVKAWVYTKLALHAADIILCICAIAISFSLGGHGTAGYAFVLCTPIFFVAFIWDVAEIMTWLLRKRQAGIHPGAHVAMSLLIWMAAAVVGGIQSAFVGFSVYDDYDTSGTCWDSGRQESVDCDDDSDRYGSVRAKFLAVAVFSCLVWLVHFILFVGACVDTAKRNAALRRVMVVAPPYWGHAVQGWQPMPQQYYPQQGTAAPGQQQAQQNIPLQTRSPAPAEQSAKGKEVDTGVLSTQPPAPQGGGVTEYYSPSQTR
ncbi:hypothetical protein B0T10DRAFT_488140 [Thelonectria olida]|uniref:MARVEL domain-containing protein n=1 Tax=Thelonectria olida TaxID=1576542 RepID=A0A9P9APN0_9HYPO|nr:hypothetical protein B0T10DRAFT_488140 [Thelonectria olida]